MRNENTEKIRERVISLIESEFSSDAAFEREMGIPEKTVNNWRRGRSSSFMSMLPRLSERFGVNVGELFDIPPRKDTSELSSDEIELLKAYRRSRTMPQKMRIALKETLESVINLYIQTVNEQKKSKTKK
jgi:transcriptional regulator with XRE-family HTH domain